MHACPASACPPTRPPPTGNWSTQQGRGGYELDPGRVRHRVKGGSRGWAGARGRGGRRPFLSNLLQAHGGGTHGPSPTYSFSLSPRSPSGTRAASGSGRATGWATSRDMFGACGVCAGVFARGERRSRNEREREVREANLRGVLFRSLSLSPGTARAHEHKAPGPWTARMPLRTAASA